MPDTTLLQAKAGQRGWGCGSRPRTLNRAHPPSAGSSGEAGRSGKAGRGDEAGCSGEGEKRGGGKGELGGCGLCRLSLPIFSRVSRSLWVRGVLVPLVAGCREMVVDGSLKGVRLISVHQMAKRLRVVTQKLCPNARGGHCLPRCWIDVAVPETKLLQVKVRFTRGSSSGWAQRI